MKASYIILFTLTFFKQLSLFAQIKTYDSDWKKVDELWQKKNLPKSALSEVQKIYAKAKSEKQEAQIIKSLVYLTSLQQQTRENNEAEAIKEIEKEVNQQSGAAQALLQSMLAGMYWQYLQNHRWQLYNRTNTVNFAKENIATWTTEDLHKKISNLYLASLHNEKMLQQTGLTSYEAIVVKGNVRQLRPTLYDLLAHRALDYFKNNERDIKKPAYAFQIEQPEVFAPAQQFAAANFKTKDSFSLQHKALLIYQKLLNFHLPDTKRDALIDVDVDRIEYVQRHAVLEHKDSLYAAALQQIIRLYSQNPATHQASYLLAEWYNEQASHYNPFGDTTYRYKRMQVKEVLERVVKDSSNKANEGWVNSYNLLRQINQPQFSFEVEKVNLPGQPFRSLLKYTNVSQLYFRIIKASDELKKAMTNENGEEKYWTTILKAEPLKSWGQPLPATNDLQQHSVEIKVDALPIGEYFLLASTKETFEKKTNLLGGQFFHVSGISYINKGNDYFVLHRETGQPLVKALVTVYAQEYNYNTSRYNKIKKGSYNTNEKGYFKLPQAKKEERNYNYTLDVLHNGDRLRLDDYNYAYYEYDNSSRIINPSTKLFFFTDRSIYRPGQAVYFKAIAVNGPAAASDVAVGYKTTIYLRNANGQVTDSVQATSNEFGSFNGKFILPQGVLNGLFMIVERGNRNATSISVEEYKRPKFAVEFEKIKDSYKVGDTITLTGKAKAYAGNSIDGAKVVYRVVRQPRFLYPWLLWRGWFPRTEAMEITYGEVTTDASGNFSIHFKAIPDKEIDKKFEPLFDYKVHADVTDINGETRSGDKTVSAGYKSLLLSIEIPERVMKDSLKFISIRTENMNGNFQPAPVQVSITKLLPENRLIRDRYWSQPDQFVFSKEEFLSFFPHDEYQNESDPKTGQKGEVVFTKKETTKESGQHLVDNKSFSAGHYEITVTTNDKEGKEVKDVRYVEVFNANQPSVTPKYLWAYGSQEAVEPGQTTHVQIGSSANNVYVISETDKGKKTLQTDGEASQETTPYNFINISNEKKTFAYTPAESDRGGFGVIYFFVKDNRFYQFGEVIHVPWSNKELKVEFATFRDKTLPGSEEKWKVKITGSKSEQVASEMLASMYDASLDQFKPHSWQKPNLWPVYNSLRQWNGRQNFSEVQSQENYLQTDDARAFNKIYDRLVLGLYESYRDGFAGALAGRAPGVALQSMRRENLEEVVVGYGVRKVELEKFSPPVIKDEDKAAADTVTNTETAQQTDTPIQIRKNFNETAFFFPDLRTDESGTIEFSFTAPEALTKWKLQTLSHTKELAFGVEQKELTTQKELMVQPNAPRFLRQGDNMEFPVKVVNLTDKEITGQLQLQLIDAATNQSVDGWFLNTFPNQYFTVAAGQSEAVAFPIQVPYTFTSSLTWRVVARSNNLSDGEENVLPVLTNKILVTETLPLPMQGFGTKQFTFKKLQQAGSETLQHQSLTFEYTSNPVWYAVQALPYLMEYPYDCAEQNWNRYYANALAGKIVNSAPRIKQIFERWKNTDTSALLSNLQKNSELKSALLEETPWVLQAQSEEEQKNNIALLFDLVRLGSEAKSSLSKLQNLQSSDGGFVWFKGGPDDRYITQYILTGIGHLKKLGVDVSELKGIVNKALPYLDRKLVEEYTSLVKSKSDMKKQQTGYMAVHYLYMRSFFSEYDLDAAAQKASAYYRGQLQQFWMKQNQYSQGMIALALHRTGDEKTPQAIVRSLKETSILHEEQGRYWLANAFGRSWYWYEAPIETQALMIEVFNDVSKDQRTVNELCTWLIKNKQTNNWRTTKATAEACYAMLLQGNDWLSVEPVVKIKFGNSTIDNSKNSEAGTGYFKQTIPAKNITTDMGNIIVTVQPSQTANNNQKTSIPSWGAAYWQYFEDMDKITTAATPLQLQKKLFVEKNSDRGPVLSPVTEGSEVHVGDKIKVRIELHVDRDMEYVHMKDMRASGLEPVNVLSGYKWQGGLGYYETTRDASTNFFFNYLRKGTYVFEYPMFVAHSGNFSNGITTIQCMYAPEFSAHSEGVKIRVEK